MQFLQIYAAQESFHTHFRVQVMLIVEDSIVSVKWRTAIKALFLYFNMCLKCNTG